MGKRKGRGGDNPGKAGKEATKRILRWMIYRKPNGLYGISLLGWVALTLLVMAVLGVVYIIQILTV